VCAHRVFTQMQTIIQIKPPVEYSYICVFILYRDMMIP
jgi:hypothetical protein